MTKTETTLASIAAAIPTIGGIAIMLALNLIG